MIFDVNNPPTKADSDLDSDLSKSSTFIIKDGAQQAISPGDWVDVDPSIISPDPDWGYSFQVCALYPDDGLVGILVCTNPESAEEDRNYAETSLSADQITNNFRRVPRT